MEVLETAQNVSKDGDQLTKRFVPQQRYPLAIVQKPYVTPIFHLGLLCGSRSGKPLQKNVVRQ